MFFQFQVLVYDKKTGQIIPIQKSPHFTNLSQWLSQNPNCEPVKPGTTQHQMVMARKPPTPPTTPHSPTKHPLVSSSSAEDLFSNPVKINTGASPVAATKKPQGQHSVNSASIRSNVSVKTTGAAVVKLTPLTKSPSVTSTSSKPTTPKVDPKKIKRQVSEERPPSSSSSKFKTEQERLSVRNILKETLKLRMQEFDHPQIPKMSDDEIATFAKETEKEMFLYFNKDTRDKYKTKYRSLKFNLGDVKNKTLLEKICAKKLTPKQLVELPPAALASEELSKWREDENKHQLEIITKSELDALAQTKIVVKTHKGEEIIETKSTPSDILVPIMDDVESVIAKSILSVEDPHGRYDLSRSISLNVSGEKNISSPLSSPSISSSTGRKSDSRHRSRSRSKSKGKDHHHHHHHKSSSSSSKHKKSEHHRSKSPKHHKSRDKSNERSKAKKSDDHKSRDKSKSREKDKPAASKQKPKEKKPLDIQPDQQDVDLVGKILDSMGVHLDKPVIATKPEEKKIDVKPTIVVPPILSIEPINEHKLEIEIYSGNMHMADVAKFEVNASLVSGNVDDIIKLFPPQLEVVGRIEPATVWDYLTKVKRLPGKEICILRFASTDEAGYFQFFSYLHTRQRYGVIKSTSPKIKDFYVVPVEASRPLPKILLPIVGPGFIEGDDHKPDLLLGVILKITPEVKVSLHLHQDFKHKF